MRGRLLVLLSVLLGALLTAVFVPLAQSYTTTRSQQLYIDRLGDTSRFAALAEQALSGERGAVLQAELSRYHELFGGSVVLVDADGTVVLTSGAEPDTGAPGVADAIGVALAGQPAQRVPDAWPWQRQDYVIAEPVGRGSQVLGAVVTVSPTASARADVARRLLWLALIGFGCALAVAGAVALPMVRWILRPVHDLDAAAQELRRGHLRARAPVDEGPPELRGLATSFNAMAASLQSALDQQRAFVADASHQLRNPLTALRLRVEQLVDASAATPDRAAVATAALRETDRLAGTVDGLLQLARAEATMAERRPVDLAAVAAARLRAWQPVLPGAVLAGPPDRAAAAATALARTDVVEEILDVLLDNAAKYAGGAAVTVTAGAPAPAGFVALRVHDDGPGLPDAEAARLGERFYRAPSHRAVPGTGLGLSIARTLAEAADGELHIDHSGGGFTVTLHLPAAAGALVAAGLPRRTGQAG